VASELPALPDHPDERLIAIAKHFGADTYLAGSGGRITWLSTGMKETA